MSDRIVPGDSVDGTITPPLNLTNKPSAAAVMVNKKRKKVNFNLTLDLTREISTSPDAVEARRVPQQHYAVSDLSSAGSDFDDCVPTTPGGRLQVEQGVFTPSGSLCTKCGKGFELSRFNT
jgi:hypothetical protein